MRDQPSPALPSPDTSVPPGLVEALARAVVAVLSPPPRPLNGGADNAADFLTAGEFARRLGVSRETVRRLAIAGVLPHTVVCRGARQTTRRFPQAVRRRFRGQRHGCSRPGGVRRAVAGPCRGAIR